MNKPCPFLLMFLFCVPLLISAQGWEFTYGESEIRYVDEADLTDDGHVIFCGEKRANGSNTLDQAFIYKVAPNGALVWEYADTVHIKNYVNTRDVISTSDGGYLLGFIYDDDLPMDFRALQKISADGTLEWEFDMESSVLQRPDRLFQANDGGYLIYSIIENPSNPQDAGILKLDAQGNIVWETTYTDIARPYITQELLQLSTGEIYVTGYVGYDNFDTNAYVYKMDANGNKLWTHEFDGPISELGIELAALDNGDILVAELHGEQYPSDRFLALNKLSATGQELWSKDYPALGALSNIGGLEITSDGGMVLSSSADIFSTGGADMFLMKLDSAGNQEWINNYGQAGSDFNIEVLVHATGYYLIGQTASDAAYVVKTDSLGVSFTNEFNGQVFIDENFNCQTEAGEVGLHQWVVSAEKGTDLYYSITDEFGNFSFTLDEGNYEINCEPISNYWSVCNDSFNIDIIGQNQMILQDIGAWAIFDCPLMNVSIGTPFLRRCFPNTYNVQYCNLGTVTAEDAYVEVLLDTFMTVLNTSIPIESQLDNLLSFDLGDVPIGQCGDFNIEVELGDPANCEEIPLGLTHCVVAHIYPDSLCMIDPLWSGASLEVDGICQGDSIVFIITNVGSAAMVAATDYIIIEDDVILSVGSVNLDINESMIVAVATNGSTFTIQVDQEPNHPGESTPAVSVENCAADNVQFSLGFVNVFPQNDGNSFIDIDCLENGGSYDPNDKIGFPLGHSDENYILAGQMIDYMIRFQNTGTDTAFNIVIQDELSELLNISSVRPGASSHPYDYSLSAEGILTFSFNNVQLPDSTVDLAGSNGFVKFKVAQKENLPLESQIYNSAAIYFDFNAPIITNQTLHTIGEPLENMVSVDKLENGQANLKIYPNPFSSSVNFFIDGMDLQTSNFQLFSAQGRLIHQENFQGQSLLLDNLRMAAGLYFFTIESEGVLISSGKIMRQ